MRTRSPLIRFIVDNLGWLLASVALASLIWYAAVTAANPIEQRRLAQRVAVELRYDPGMIILNRQPTTVQVTIRGLRSMLNEIAPENISVIADLTNRGPDTYTVPLSGALVGVRGGAIVSIEPSRITVELERRDEKRVNIAVVFTQDPPVGYTAAATPAEPNVLVSGPASRVDQVTAVQARINLEGRRTPFSLTTPLIAVDENGNTVPDVVLSPPEVRLSVEVQQRPDVTELLVEPRLIGDLPTGYLRRNYNWEPKRIVVRGDQEAIAELGGVIPTEPVLLTGRTQSFTQTVRLALPPGVTMPDPVDITITVEIEPVMVTREFVNILVQTQGLDPADYQITVQPDRVNVIVRGPQVVVDGLLASDISVFAPLGGLATGTHTVTLEASVANPDIADENVIIPNQQAEVVIVARNPTSTPSPAAPSRTPTRTPGP